MQKLDLDLGVREYEIGGGVLRFNPSDPNVYDRLMRAGDKLKAIEKDLVASAKKLAPEGSGELSGDKYLSLLAEADRRMKSVLKWVFGVDNDFNAIFRGVNVMAVGPNGELAITNFVAAITPVVAEGARKRASQQSQAAVARAQANRAKRRKAKRK